MNRFDMLDFSVEENRRAFRMAIETSESDAIGHVAALATRLEIHRAYNATSPGLFVLRNDANDEPGTIVGICGGRRFLISDSDVAWTVWQWRRLEQRSHANDIHVLDLGDPRFLTKSALVAELLEWERFNFRRKASRFLHSSS